jgi:hypothetical protein
MYQYQNLPQNFWVLSFGFWVQLWVLGIGFWVSFGFGCFGFWVSFGFGFGDLGFVRPWIMMIIFTKKVALFASRAPQNTSS